MIKAIFFDLYNTLVRFWPPLEEIQQTACLAEGIEITQEQITRGYALADDYFSRENTDHPLYKRTPQELDAFFSEYERLILKGAGIEVMHGKALAVWKHTQKVTKRLAWFDDVPPALERLHAHGLVLGGISNLRPEMRGQMESIGLMRLLDFVVTSQEAGAQKPYPPIFLAALERAHAKPEEAVHVGDQYHSDVQGARGVGIMPVLLDRRSAFPGADNCICTHDMSELVKLYEEGRLEPR
jgi:HAD superfamily hydrolase (TIGR01549 family)